MLAEEEEIKAKEEADAKAKADADAKIKDTIDISKLAKAEDLATLQTQIADVINIIKDISSKTSVDDRGHRTLPSSSELDGLSKSVFENPEVVKEFERLKEQDFQEDYVTGLRNVTMSIVKTLSPLIEAGVESRFDTYWQQFKEDMSEKNVKVTKKDREELIGVIKKNPHLVNGYDTFHNAYQAKLIGSGEIDPSMLEKAVNAKLEELQKSGQITSLGTITPRTETKEDLSKIRTTSGNPFKKEDADYWKAIGFKLK